MINEPRGGHPGGIGGIGTDKAVSAYPVDRDKRAAHQHVSNWIASQETRKERPVPKRV